MKKRFLVLALLVMAMCLGGCGDNNGGTTTSATTPDTTEEVTSGNTEDANDTEEANDVEEANDAEEADNTIEVKLTSSSPSRPFTVTINFPANEAGDEADCETEVKTSSVIFKNDKITIEAKLGSFVYNSYADYKEKYGDKETNYANYVEYWEDPDFDSHKGTVMPVKTNIAGLEAMAFDFDSSMKYTLNNSDFYSDSQFDIIVSSNDNSVKISELLEDAEVKAIIDSIKISN